MAPPASATTPLHMSSTPPPPLHTRCKPTMPDVEVDPDVASGAQSKSRTFRKFTYHGVDLDALIDMSTDDLVQMFPACARRRFKRGLKRKPMALVKKLRKAVAEVEQGKAEGEDATMFGQATYYKLLTEVPSASAPGCVPSDDWPPSSEDSFVHQGDVC